MKKRMILIIALAVFLVLSGCGATGENNKKTIVSFSFNEGGYPGYYEAKIRRLNDGAYRFSSDGFWTEGNSWGYNDFCEKKGRISSESVERIQDLIEEYNIDSWNGFDESDSNVQDGNGFTLKVKYDDGSELSASGYMIFPENFSDAEDALYTCLKEIAISIEDAP